MKSRLGVIHSCMVDMHSNVPCILHTPSTKHTAHSSGRNDMCGAARLQAITPVAAAASSVLLVNLNFILNRIGKYTAIPARLA